MKKYVLPKPPFIHGQEIEAIEVVEADLAEEILEILKEHLEYFENVAMDMDIAGLDKKYIILRIDRIRAVLDKAEAA